MANPESSLDLQAGGLWMPLMTAWYQDESLLSKWAIGNPAHPDGYVDAVAKQTLTNGIAGPTYTLRNFAKIDAIVSAALDKVWLGEVSAQEAMDEACATAQAEMQGRYGK
jgi:multiple sugar transport system substrate-binding protein